jgi:hypothetical protein
MTWTRLQLKGTIPLPRNCHSMTAIKDKLYLWGGYGAGVRLNEMFVLDTGMGAHSAF